MTPTEVTEIVREARDKDIRANLAGANLAGASLAGANLRYVNLAGADLRYANLRYASLRDANLADANLAGANLLDANLWDANLLDANLCGADLRGAIIVGAKGLLHASCCWSRHGESGRQLLGVIIDNDPRYFCGCWSGTGDDLEQYIAKGKDEHKASRTVAYEFVSARLREMQEGEA